MQDQLLINAIKKTAAGHKVKKSSGVGDGDYHYM